MAAAVVVLAVLRHGGMTSGAVSSALWALWLVLAAGTVFTAVMPMMAVFGEHGQTILLWSHRLAATAFAIVSLAACATAFAGRRRG